MPNEPTWLAADLIIEFNQLIVAETRAARGSRSSGARERARQADQLLGLRRDGRSGARCGAAGRAREKPPLLAREQANRRLPGDYFLHLNGYELTIEDSTELADFIIDVINGDVSEQRLVETLWEYIQPL